MTNLTLEEYRSAVLDELDRLEFQSIFDRVSEITGQYATELTSITAKLIDTHYQLDVDIKTSADVLFHAAIMAFSEVFGNLTKN